MKKCLFCVIPLILMLIGCTGSARPAEQIAEYPSAAPGGMTLDQAIKEAAGRIDERITTGSKIVLLNFSSPSDRFSSYTLDELEANLLDSGILIIVDRREVERIRSELNIQSSGEVGDDSIQNVGARLGAQSVVSGSLMEIGGTYRMVVRVLNVQNATVEAQYRTDIAADSRVLALLEGGRSTAAVTVQPARPAAAAQTPAAPVRTLPPTPQNLRAASIRENSVEITWSSSNWGSTGVGFQVYYSTSADAASATLAGSVSNRQSYSFSNLRNNTLYYFWVTSVERNTESAKSEVLSITTPRYDYVIGDTGPAGGLIFYDKGVYTNGWRFMEAAPNDIGPAPWGANGTEVSGTSTAIGGGRGNTQSIVPVLTRAREDGAALLCSSLNISGFTDWFLPSKDELNLMYTNLAVRGLGRFSNSCYWTSSEGSGRAFSLSTSSSESNAWMQYFNNGSQYQDRHNGSGKNNAYQIRAARQF
ncbi:MAG: fibronectin type III domain-containing protein [Treponema sp.]|nr:fibronectin type III domain-containing protein [Treponema sp.]